MDSKETTKSGGCSWGLIFFIVIVCAVAIVILTPCAVSHFADDTDRGTFGDMFGATNALFSGLAFAGLIVTIFMQRSEIQLQRQEFIRSVDTQAALLEVARSEQRDREAREHRAATLVLGGWNHKQGVTTIGDEHVTRYDVVNKGQSVTDLSVSNIEVQEIKGVYIDYPEMLPANENLIIIFRRQSELHWSPKPGSRFTLGYVDANGDRRQQSYEWRGGPLGFYCTDLGFEEKPDTVAE